MQKEQYVTTIKNAFEMRIACSYSLSGFRPLLDSRGSNHVSETGCRRNTSNTILVCFSLGELYAPSYMSFTAVPEAGSQPSTSKTKSASLPMELAGWRLVFGRGPELVSVRIGSGAPFVVRS